ncbi:acylphosphatase [Arsenophonus endosymbiont of Bemisia tabaci]|uniref:acylphosphatase n=1 Tax=Arsenophonus endosymbiont of Bemisia tabaci TaxID=536059 RepID=UPI0015F70EF3|nr:acylphosphatase [Arsenophonus endosymbiont of Bemisia tabaci]CAA2930019.1 Acylphosphatase [Arsenophonus endosymbiont of Bemisia tabaci Q2]
MRKIVRNYYIYEQVQGVGFCYHTFHWGKEHGLYGYVYNRYDSSVNIKAFSTLQQIQQLEDWLKACGSVGAKIEYYKSEECHVEKEVVDFHIRHSL